MVVVKGDPLKGFGYSIQLINAHIAETVLNQSYAYPQDGCSRQNCSRQKNEDQFVAQPLQNDLTSSTNQDTEDTDCMDEPGKRIQIRTVFFRVFRLPNASANDFSNLPAGKGRQSFPTATALPVSFGRKYR